MSLPYEEASAGGNAIREMERILGAFGCQSFGTMTDAERGLMIVVFKWRDRQVQLEASWKGYGVAWQKEHPWNYRWGSRQKYDEKALSVAKTAICSVLRDWVKGSTTAIECGVLSFEAAFMPHMLLKDGRRVIDAAAAAGILPPPEKNGPKVVEFKQ